MLIKAFFDHFTGESKVQKQFQVQLKIQKQRQLKRQRQVQYRLKRSTTIPSSNFAFHLNIRQYKLSKIILITPALESESEL